MEHENVFKSLKIIRIKIRSVDEIVNNHSSHSPYSQYPNINPPDPVPLMVNVQCLIALVLHLLTSVIFKVGRI